MPQDSALSVYKPNPRQYVAAIPQVTNANAMRRRGKFIDCGAVLVLRAPRSTAQGCPAAAQTRPTAQITPAALTDLTNTHINPTQPQPPDPRA